MTSTTLTVNRRNGHSREAVLETIRKYWGYNAFRPLQEEAIAAGLERKDSLVVLPTGGGKSLCYQVPPALENRTDIVVSPLISLMKDQVDGLRECGYPAAALYSGISAADQRVIEREAQAGVYRLLFVAPERLLTPSFLRLVDPLGVRSFAIDEAHCISHWGHDFRPEYRRLAELKTRFPSTAIHAFTATATERVRRDIVEQLRLADCTLLVGSFDRPNLVYRVVPRTDGQAQTLEVISRHSGQAVIVYCISRKDTESMARYLRENKVRAAHYHAGMNPEQRRRTQDAFSTEKIDVVVATVAFGMGIDRSDVRCVIHAAMPKSVEHYQQETGRAGRDGLEAECVLFYSAADALKWQSLMERSAEESHSAPEALEASLSLLGHMRRFCQPDHCRHQALVEYFGQIYPSSKCKACDFCLDEVEGLEDGTVSAQKILSCVARVQERFGVMHVIDVLLGADTERIRQFGHDRLSTYGLMKDHDRRVLKNQIYQLIDSAILDRSDEEYPVLRLNAASWEVMRGERPVKLLKLTPRKIKAGKAELDSWEGVDRGLFEELRGLRRALADQRGVPPFVIFSDATLRGMARIRPTAMSMLATVYGIGRRKAEDFGDIFLSLIREHCGTNHLNTDLAANAPTERSEERSVSAGSLSSFSLWREGLSIEQVAAKLDRALSTVTGYLADYITSERPASIGCWVEPGVYRQVAQVAQEVGTERLKPIYDALNAQVRYDVIRLVVAHMDVNRALPSDAR